MVAKEEMALYLTYQFPQTKRGIESEDDQASTIRPRIGLNALRTRRYCIWSGFDEGGRCGFVCRDTR